MSDEKQTLDGAYALKTPEDSKKLYADWAETYDESFAEAHDYRSPFLVAEAYRDAGGFPHAPLFEEVPLVRGLRRTGRFGVLPVAIGVDPRRWERDGWWRRSLNNRRLALAYMMGASPERLSREYGSPVESRRSGC